jgi:hypothetical protein
MKSTMKLRLRIIECFGNQEKFSVAAGIPDAIVSKIVHRLRQPTRTQKEIFYNLPGFQFD